MEGREEGREEGMFKSLDNFLKNIPVTCYRTGKRSLHAEVHGGGIGRVQAGKRTGAGWRVSGNENYRPESIGLCCLCMLR